jgi:hypothetical protein
MSRRRLRTQKASSNDGNDINLTNGQPGCLRRNGTLRAGGVPILNNAACFSIEVGFRASILQARSLLVM